VLVMKDGAVERLIGREAAAAAAAPTEITTGAARADAGRNSESAS
jgi:hypothetical protein